MRATFNLHAAKRKAILCINGDLLNQAKALDIDMSAMLEHALGESLRQKRREQWLAENCMAIGAYNEYVEAHGQFSDGLRSF